MNFYGNTERAKVLCDFFKNLGRSSAKLAEKFAKISKKLSQEHWNLKQISTMQLYLELLGKKTLFH